MPNYGFAIDLRKCIGCHACTIACKAEHEIPVGVNRCWVKTVEKGTFPDTRRFFFPVLCNQCDEAPCVKICPTNALFKRRDGIVDLHGDSCIGCRACMVACPYDQLFIDPNTHTAEKCNFCANRVENKLLPACVSVCPTECRIFGDLDDPTSEVAQIVAARGDHRSASRRRARARRSSTSAPTTACMQPEIADAAVHVTRKARCCCGRSDRRRRIRTRPATPRVDYDTPHEKPWGLDMALYLLTKGISTGAMLLSALLLVARRSIAAGRRSPARSSRSSSSSRTAVAPRRRSRAAGALLLHPHAAELASWMVWGAYFLTAHGAIAALWLAAGWLGLHERR